jgi:hypothetical protein
MEEPDARTMIETCFHSMQPAEHVTKQQTIVGLLLECGFTEDELKKPMHVLYPYVMQRVKPFGDANVIRTLDEFFHTQEMTRTRNEHQLSVYDVNATIRVNHVYEKQWVQAWLFTVVRPVEVWSRYFSFDIEGADGTEKVTLPQFMDAYFVQEL